MVKYPSNSCKIATDSENLSLEFYGGVCVLVCFVLANISRSIEAPKQTTKKVV